MTKAQLQTLITTNLASGQPITAELHREVENGIVNEMFPTIHNMFLGSDGNNLNYNLRFSRIGSLVYLNGYIKNDTQFIINNQPLITIDNSLYFAKTVRPPQLVKNNIEFIILTDVLLLNTFLPVGEFIFFNDIYQTND